MKGDFSRLTFDPAKGYTSVRQQQGRLQLDADWNEQADVFLHQLETFGGDLIGASGAPAQELVTFIYQKSSTGGTGTRGTGTVVLALGTSVFGLGTQFITEVKPDTNQNTEITIGGQVRTVTSVLSATFLRVDKAFSPLVLGPKDFTYRKSGVPNTRGTGTVRTTGKAVFGSGTQFNTQVKPETNQDVKITIGGQMRTVTRVFTDTMLLVDEAFSPDLPLPANFQISESGGGLVVAAGRYYVGGMLCELEADVSLTAQPDLPGYTLPAEDGLYLAYLEACELHETAVDWPDLREPALGGPDTASRTRVVAQVRLAPVSTASCDAFKSLTLPGSAPPFELAAQATSPLADRLYRVEIHAGGPLGTATFKWARDNATALAPIETLGPGEVTVASLVGLDGENAFAAGDWVEVTDRQRTLAGEPGVLVRLSRVQGQVLTVEAWPGGIAPTLSDGAVLRRWDSEGDAVVTTAGFLPLEDGVEVSFMTPSSLAQALSGDAWMIPARTAIGTAGGGVLWPPPTGSPSTPTFLPPQGRPRRYAPLAIVDRKDGVWTVKSDCRDQFGHLSALAGLGIDPASLDTKVNKSGDTMTGPLLIDSDLAVAGAVRLGTASTVAAKLEVQGGDVQIAAGNDERSGILFPSAGTGTAASQGFVRFHQPSNSGPRLVFGTTGGAADTVVLRQGVIDRLVVSSGRVGIGGPPSLPTLDGLQLDVLGAARTESLRIEGKVTIAGGAPEPGALLTCFNASGLAIWEPLSTRRGLPYFLPLPSRIGIDSGTGQKAETLYTFDSRLPEGATAVILEGQAAADDGDGRILIFTEPGASRRLLLRARALSSGDSGAWSSQGVFPLNGRSIYYVVVQDEATAFAGGWNLTAIGYYL